jgi:hypothetical protein
MSSAMSLLTVILGAWRGGADIIIFINASG